MKKCLLLFIFFLASIVLLKFSETASEKEANKDTVEQLVDDTKDSRIVRK